MTSQCIGTSKLINTLVSGRNTRSYHRYDGPIDRYSSQSDFSDGAATTWYFREVCSSQHPIKISRTNQATFFKELSFWANANRFTELGARRYQRASTGWGGGPPPRILQLVVNLTKCLIYKKSDLGKEVTLLFNVLHVDCTGKNLISF